MRFHRTRRQGLITESEILPYNYNSNNPGTKTKFPGPILPPKVWKTQPQWLIDGLARAHGRYPAAPGGGKALSLNNKFFHACTTSRTRGQNCIPRVDTARTVVLTFHSECYATARFEYYHTRYLHTTMDITMTTTMTTTMNITMTTTMNITMNITITTTMNITMTTTMTITMNISMNISMGNAGLAPRAEPWPYR